MLNELFQQQKNHYENYLVCLHCLTVFGWLIVLPLLQYSSQYYIKQCSGDLLCFHCYNILHSITFNSVWWLIVLPLLQYSSQYYI